jgi:hypothetical protein
VQKERFSMKLRLQFAMLLLAIILCAPSLFAQAQRSISNPLFRPGAAEGQLTVTLTVVTSVGVVMDENGKPTIVIANPRSRRQRFLSPPPISDRI